MGYPKTDVKKTHIVPKLSFREMVRSEAFLSLEKPIKKDQKNKQTTNVIVTGDMATYSGLPGLRRLACTVSELTLFPLSDSGVGDR